MRVKKFYLFLFAFSISLYSHAQVDFGIFGGPQFSGAVYKINDTKQDVEYKPGLQLGAIWKIPFEEKLYFTPAAFYSLKGYKVKFSGISYPPGEEAMNNNTSIHILEITGLLQYNFTENPSHLFVKAGPSFEFTVKGTEEYGRPDGSTVKRDMPLSFTQYGRWGVNVLAQLGYETSKGLFVFGQYSIGTGNMSNTQTNTQINYRAYNLSVGKYISRRHIRRQKRF